MLVALPPTRIPVFTMPSNKFVDQLEHYGIANRGASLRGQSSHYLDSEKKTMSAAFLRRLSQFD